jgi:hypothetical protein
MFLEKPLSGMYSQKIGKPNNLSVGGYKQNNLYHLCLRETYLSFNQLYIKLALNNTALRSKDKDWLAQSQD